MSMPISAMITWAAVRPTPVISSNRPAAHAKGTIASWISALHRGDVGAGLVDAAKHGGQQEGVMVAKAATEGLLQQTPLGAQAGPRQLGQDLGVALAGQQRGQHGPSGDPEDVAGDHRELDLRVLQQLLHQLLFSGSPRHQIGAVAGQVPQAADRRRHEAWPQHLPLGDLAQPHRVQLVGLGPAG